jgi:hypothetical protein
MLKKYLLLFLFASICVISTYAQNSRKDRIIASYMLAFGRPPQQAEINYWLTDPLSNQNLKVLVEKHRSNMNTVDRSLRETAVKQSYIDAFGRVPEKGELDYWMGSTNTYAEMVQLHVDFLKSRPEEWVKVIRASYKMAFKRAPKSEELAYWKGQPARTFFAMVVQHDEFIRNNPHLGPANSTARTSLIKKENKVTITPSIISEIKLIGGGVISTGGGNVISTGGGNVISTGGGNVISTGGGN